MKSQMFVGFDIINVVSAGCDLGECNTKWNVQELWDQSTSVKVIRTSGIAIIIFKCASACSWYASFTLICQTFMQYLWRISAIFMKMVMGEIWHHCFCSISPRGWSIFGPIIISIHKRSKFMHRWKFLLKKLRPESRRNWSDFSHLWILLLIPMRGAWLSGIVNKYSRFGARIRDSCSMNMAHHLESFFYTP